MLRNNHQGAIGCKSHFNSGRDGSTIHWTEDDTARDALKAIQTHKHQESQRHTQTPKP